MFWINGRFSWPLIFAVAYTTAAIVAADIAWRLVNAPIAWIAGGGAVCVLAGSAAILLLGARAGTR